MLMWRTKERKQVRKQLEEIFAEDHEEYIVSEALGANLHSHDSLAVSPG